jgi:hypothetical protein
LAGNADILNGVPMDGYRLTRREFAAGLAAGTSLLASASPGKWTNEWDKALLENAVAAQDQAYDPAESMLVRPVGAEYHYHTNIRSSRAHPTRDSLDYALNLLETGKRERQKRAFAVLERLLALQDTDPNSKWYGLWGYYMEEPADKMSPADWNWADFNGSTLLMVNARHSEQLSTALRVKVLEAIHHCAISVMRRNVTMTYTNIATQGTFVTLAAAAVTKDEKLRQYAEDRMRRLCQTIDETGSFAEYNSPTYANVTIVNLTRIRMLVRNPEMLRLADRIHGRIWLHLASHWHAPTGQLAGPMSRCYSTDIGKPLWLQKALDGAIPFATLDDVRSGRARGEGEISYLEYRCPAPLVAKFTNLSAAREQREVFLFTGKENLPVEGTTYLNPALCIGSANRSEFWIQRRPLLAFWGNRSRPARFLQMRVVKDDYDFSSALFYSVQSGASVACLVNFRSPGGDKHISLDPIPNGEFKATRLRVRFDLAHVSPQTAILINGKKARLGEKYPADAQVSIDLGGALLGLRFRSAKFAGSVPALAVAAEDGMLTVSLDFLDQKSEQLLQWNKISEAFAAATVHIAAPGKSLTDFDAEFGRQPCSFRLDKRTMELDWAAWGSRLHLAGATGVNSVEEQNKLASFSLNGQSVPIVRLSSEKLLS